MPLWEWWLVEWLCLLCHGTKLFVRFSWGR
uniref:Uncharacterized protein n=1 Tax=Nymphaea colorata TaxID=210225 RepID=A0A5K1GWS6_9MAGN